MLPGQSLAGLLRKRFFDEEVRAALGEGAGQVLIIGSGFDTLGWRVADDHPTVLVEEVDRPLTISLKHEAIEKLGARPPNLHLHGFDLADTPLTEVLDSATGWRDDRRSVVVAEGVLMYLDPEDVARFLDALREATGPGSRLVFSYLGADEQGRPVLGRTGALLEGALKMMGEPLRWCVRPGELAPFLSAHGLRLLGPPERYDLHARYVRAPWSRRDGYQPIERFAVAEFVP